MKHLAVIIAFVLIAVSAVSACPYDVNPQHYVHFEVAYCDGEFSCSLALTDSPIVGEPLTVAIEPVPIETYDWIHEVLGVSRNTNESYERAPPVTLITDSEGSVDVPMSDGIEYNISFRNRSYYLYPAYDDYKIFTPR